MKARFLDTLAHPCRAPASARVAQLLGNVATHAFVCGLKAMEQGVDDALGAVRGGAGLDGAALKSNMRSTGRYQVETY